MKYADIISTPTPQSQPLSAKQVKNNAGGFVYEIDKWDRLDRFLILGSDSQTYYQTAQDLTRQNAQVVLDCYAEDAARTVARIVEISDQGRAPKNDPAIFALALGASYKAGEGALAAGLSTLKADREEAATAVRQLALGALPKVCRTSTHLFQFVKASKALGRGFGRAFKRAVSNWYAERPVDSVAYQAIKYRQRDGFTHKRLLDMSHSPAKIEPVRQNLYHWIKGKAFDKETLPKVAWAHLEAMSSTSPQEWVDLVKEYKLPWEALPTEANANPGVWTAMVPHLGLTALIRNLGNMTRVGAIKPLSETEAQVVARLSDETELRKSRVHPFAILQAMAVYKSGHGLKGSGTWTPSRPVIDALDNAFYKTFKNVDPTNKRHLLALDVSGSMGSPFGGSVLTCRDATAALALVTMSVEQSTHVIGFTASGKSTYSTTSGSRFGMGSAVSELSISPRQRLTDAIGTVSGLPFGNTDCAIPMLYAMERNIPVDVFTVYTDNETWHGSVHPSEALKQYRKKTGIPAKLVVVGMTATGFSIADPNDGGMLDIVGFDTNCPALISDFARQ